MSGEPRTVVFFCATYLKPEMHHIHRQILLPHGFRPVVIAQKVENPGTFPIDGLVRIPRSPWRFLGRGIERVFGGRPWQAGPGEVQRFSAVVREHNAAAIHLFFGNVAIHWLPLMRRMRDAGIPVVVSFHGADVAGAIAAPPCRSARLEMFDLAGAVVCRSAALAREVGAMGCPPAKLRVIHTVVPSDEYPSRDPSVTRHPPTILQACRLIPKKGLDVSLQAMVRIIEVHPQARLVIAGTGPMEDSLRSLARELGIERHIEFAGFVDQETLRTHFAEAALFLHPSRRVGGDTEGIPNSIVEAMAAGLPVVATHHGGILEAITDGESGILCPEADPAAVAEAVLQILGQPDLAARLGAAAKSSATRKFSRDTIGRQWGGLYRQLSRD